MLKIFESLRQILNITDAVFVEAELAEQNALNT